MSPLRSRWRQALDNDVQVLGQDRQGDGGSHRNRAHPHGGGRRRIRCGAHTDLIAEAPLPDTERFDLIVATNILVYYDPFDQALALANIAKMLKPGGYFVTNYAVSPVAPLEPSASIVTSVFFDQQGNGDTIFCYQRR